MAASGFEGGAEAGVGEVVALIEDGLALVAGEGVAETVAEVEVGGDYGF